MAATQRKRLTVDDLKLMTNSDIVEFWCRRQIEDRAASRPHYTTLINVNRDGTETVVATVDETRA